MATFEYPNPLLDYKEEILLKKLTEQYENFCNPNFMAKAVGGIENSILKITPQQIRDQANMQMEFLKEQMEFFKKQIQLATEQEVIEHALNKAAEGGGIFLHYLSEKTINKNAITEKIATRCGKNPFAFEEICALRSYKLESIVKNDNFKHIIPAIIEGGVTGYFGFYGIPANIALSYLLFLRATQKIALTYGYDVFNDPREMEIASAVTMKCLSPSKSDSVGTIGNILDKMVIASSFTSLRDALIKNKTYSEMVKNGGAELFYVQIRATANKSAQKAVEDAGEKGIENRMLKNFLKLISKNLSKKEGGKLCPKFSAIVSGSIDTYNMNRVLTGSNLIYHKRFLFEKEERIKCIMY